jgi:hypothetical protein
MAKQTGPVKLTGTIDGLCFYKMEGEYYVRRKSSLSTKRYQKDAAFSGSRRSSSRFGEGNRLASKVYQLIAEEKRVYSLFCFLKSRSILLLKEGNSLVQTEALLRDYLVAFGFLKSTKPKGNATRKAAPLKRGTKPKVAHPLTATLAVAVQTRLPPPYNASPALFPAFSCWCSATRRQIIFALCIGRRTCRSCAGWPVVHCQKSVYFEGLKPVP